MTISEIARRAGVSKGAVSFALNDRPGVAEGTRARILAIAEELGWYPNRAARSLSAARADACGLVLARPTRLLGFEPFFMQFVAGVESALSSRSVALTIQLAEDVADEVEIHRRWWAERRVDGVILVDLRTKDPRVDAVARLGLPAVVVGGPLPDGGLPAAWHAEAPVMRDVVRHLAELRHRRVARVAGTKGFVHTAARTRAFRRVTRSMSLSAEVVATDFTPESGADATRQLLTAAGRPTAIVYDSDVLAVAGLGAAQELGLCVPDDLSIVAWDDSLLCEVVRPTITAVARDVTAYGAAAARRLLAAIDEDDAGDVETARGELVVRGSTGRAPAVRRSRRRIAPNAT
ncbi:MAG TPA: LacI family DNA-binding transcriptional regulator [Gaiellaceae bacterium]